MTENGDDDGYDVLRDDDNMDNADGDVVATFIGR